MPRPLLSAVSPSFGDDPMRAAKPGQAPCAYLSRVRPTVQGWIWGAGVALVATFLLVTGTAAAAPPATPAITEPASDEQLVHPEDVHMQATGYSDPDGNAHSCTNWEIRTASQSAVVWHAVCETGLEATHIHLADGSFVNGFTHLDFDSSYVLAAQFKDSANELSAWAARPFGTYPASSPGGGIAWTPAETGYSVDEVAAGLQLPTNIAFVPHPGGAPDDPLLYVTELYGKIKVVANDGAVSDYATGLVNFDPTGDFPGSGEQGLTGIAVDPGTGDLFASRLVDDSPPDGPHYPQVVRLHSEDGGRTVS